jgi:transcriptional regulator with XRE-family HTH domain
MLLVITIELLGGKLMTLGEKIKSYRLSKKLTQKELADKVSVTAQAVSRWEQDIVEPSIDTLKRMAVIFNITLDVLLSNAFVPSVQEEKQPIIIQQFSQEKTDTRRTIGVCEKCNSPIIEGQAIHRHQSGLRNKHTLILCENCNQVRNNNIVKENRQRTKKNRFWGFFWGLLFSTPVLLIAISGFINATITQEAFFTSLLLAYVLFSFFFTFTMKNNFIHDFFWEVTSWGFVRMPGIIFSFDIDGLLFLITAKIILFFIGIGLSIVAGGFALVLCLLLAGLVLPVSLFNSFNNPDKTSI